MNTDQLRELPVKRLKAFDANDYEALKAMHSPNFVIHMSGQTLPMDMALNMMMGFKTAFPDGSHMFDEVIVEGNMAALQGSYGGTHTGPMMNIPPTGKPFRANFISISRYSDDGKLEELWINFDEMSMMRQLGLIPNGQ